MSAAAAPRAHGGLLEEETSRARFRPEDVLDLSVNVNPYGPCPEVREAVLGAPLDRYPEPAAAPARRAIAELRGVPPSRVVVGNGAVDLLWTLARTLLGPGDPLLVVEPAFSELRAAAVRAGAHVVEHRTLPEDDFRLDVAELDAVLRRVRPRVLHLATPANPSGACTPVSAVEELAARHPDTCVVADLSFLSLSVRHADGEGTLTGRVVWVHSLTKDHALAGVRVGYALAPPDVASRLDGDRPPWSVSGPAQAAAVATTTDAARRFVAESRERLLRDAGHLTAALGGLGLRCHPTDTVYVLVDLGPRRTAAAFRHALFHRHGVLVRDATSFGLPHHVRVAARPAPDVRRAVLAMEKELAR